MEFVLGLALSAHIGFNGEYNNAHPYFDIRNEKVIMGGYYNSEENVSLYFGRSTEIFKGLELETAIVSGYDMPIVPMIRLVSNDFYALIGKERTEYGLVIGYQIPLKKYK